MPRRVIVQDLDFMAAYGNTVVAARFQSELEPEREVAEFLDGVQIPAPLLLADEQAVFGHVSSGGTSPAVQ